MNSKRLFFGLAVQAPWPETLPQGRLLDASHRHLTLAFLGECNYQTLQERLPAFPSPPFKVGFVGKFDQCLFLPERHPHVVAWHVTLLTSPSSLIGYFKTLISWLQAMGFNPDTRHPFTPHVTVARLPFNKRVWEKKFTPLPLMLSTIHLYESVGGLKYVPIWSYPLTPPFEEISHTADLAFWIRGEAFDHLFVHAQGALAFHFPEILPYLIEKDQIENLDEVIIALNELVAYVDQNISCPFKAISFHSLLEEREGILHWEMIVDV